MSEPRAIRFTVPGRVIGKGRPRFAVVGGFARAYTPAKTRNNEAMIRSLAAEATHGAAPIVGPVRVEVRVYLMPAKSWSKRRKAETLYVTGKPDVDNIFKTIADGMNGIVYADDSQISEATISRRYAVDGPERVEIGVTELAPLAAAARQEAA